MIKGDKMLLSVDDELLIAIMQKKTLFDAESGVLQNGRQTHANDTA